MDTAAIISVLQESIFMIVVFVIFLIYTLKHGRQSITNLILGLYFALLISIQFPYYESLLGATSSPKAEAILLIVVFSAFTIISAMLFGRLMPREYDEGSFEGFWRKMLLAAAATAMVMSFSYHVLPVTELITPGSPIQYLFGSAQSFFWWLFAPILILFLV